MKLPIRKEFFDKIVSGKKTIEFRDAHISFVCETTGAVVVKKVIGINIIPRLSLPSEYQDLNDVFTDDTQIAFILGDMK